MNKFFPTPEEIRQLAERIRAARREACERNECDCITYGEHERMLVFHKEQRSSDRP